MEYGYQNEVRAEKDKNKAFTHYQNPANMELNEETSTLGHHYRNGVTNTNRFYGQNESEINMDKCKALIHYQDQLMITRIVNQFLIQRVKVMHLVKKIIRSLLRWKRLLQQC
ncbi:hypothetical protein F8M41_026187 [Gigaspora margarita]|uniref:Uncharacterized protein n=1 Tax=Gigaspora margarita TaxID=4874 RepID=A0A8H3XHA6_GIGMA|nr:hypothetical protein F8M41_026187 [Gigaspora margarita]